MEKLYYYYGKLRHYYQSYLASNIFNASLIIDNIYIGDVYDAYDVESFKNQNIYNVINVVTGFENIYDNSINHLCLQLIDNEEQILLDISKFLIYLLII